MELLVIGTERVKGYREDVQKVLDFLGLYYGKADELEFIEMMESGSNFNRAIVAVEPGSFVNNSCRNSFNLVDSDKPNEFTAFTNEVNELGSILFQTGDTCLDRSERWTQIQKRLGIQHHSWMFVLSVMFLCTKDFKESKCLMLDTWLTMVYTKTEV